ncbi:hypothetical protein WMF37_22180 [Sorangium sp. So ce291]|uniref:hypothetical protein n=1 Tax=Sorangium sp. So ce291 TaxID=3133294 RepID=UPI003F5DDBD1
MHCGRSFSVVQSYETTATPSFIASSRSERRVVSQSTMSGSVWPMAAHPPLLALALVAGEAVGRGGCTTTSGSRPGPQAVAASERPTTHMSKARFIAPTEP